MYLIVAGKVAWVLFAVAWYLIRRPFERSANAAPVDLDRKGAAERFLVATTTVGLGLIPLIYVVIGWPALADRPQHPLAFLLGLLAGIGALLLFRATHRALGDLWSISLQLKREHRLVTDGVYGVVRHPMYSGFWLVAISQALLLPNWFAGLAGLVGFGLLYFIRIGAEERMMIERFGDEYRAYSSRTRRVIPFIH